MNSADDSEKYLQPAAPEAEKLVLGSVLVGHPIQNITSVLKPSDFVFESNRRIFAAMVHMEASGSKVDRVTLTHEMRRRGQLESIGGISYLVSLDEGLPVLANLDAYVTLVRDKAVLRQAIAASKAAIEECLAAADPTPEILARAERTLAALAAETGTTNLRMPLEIINRAGGLPVFVSPDQRRGVETPWPSLNCRLVSRGFLPGQMVVIGARPSVGKTALACQIADYAATSGTRVVLFTLEMSAEEILMRMACTRAQINGMKISQGVASPAEIKAVSEAFSDLADPEACRLWIDDSTGCTVPAMRAALCRQNAKHPIGLVVIDYMQLLETSGRSDRRYDQVSEISRGIKRLTRELNVPIVVLAQLNREIEKERRPPRLSDLRDSGSIEQDANIVLLLGKRDNQDENSNSLMIDLDVAKQRNGPVGPISLEFLKRYTKFIEPSADGRAQAALGFAN